ncbi:hypothetical protein SSP35_14_00970 [Streptomyces sp. NBRC 110611]|nr:hypothetical protein SSP35_14_00970 [Streptomyces sp. NBRC 110611]
MNHLPEPLREHVVTVAGDGHTAGEGRALLEQELSDVFQGRIRAGDQAHVEAFLSCDVEGCGLKLHFAGKLAG